MSESAATSPAPQAQTVEEARAQVEATREQLGRTVGALAQRADLKAQVRRKLEQAKDRLGTATASLQASSSPGSAPADRLGALREVGARLLATTRANPLALLAAVLGLGWMLGRAAKRRHP